MEDIPPLYNLETIEQMRAIADVLRQRIFSATIQQPMTVTHIAGMLGEVAARIHYHVHEMEKVGLLKLVETREKGGILEKYYRAVARDITVPPALLQRASPDETIAIMRQFLENISQSFIQAALHAIQTQAWDTGSVTLEGTELWMTNAENLEVIKQIRAILAPYQNRRDIEGEQERAYVQMLYPRPFVTQQELAGAAPPSKPAAPRYPEPPKPVKRELTFVAGSLHYKRKELEKVIASGEALDIYILGACTFADDVPPDLVDRAIASFHHWGKLNASLEVREVLKRKGGEADKKST